MAALRVLVVVGELVDISRVPTLLFCLSTFSRANLLEWLPNTNDDAT